MNINNISPKAEIGKNIKLGFGVVIGDNVKIGDNCIIDSHAVIIGNTKIGDNNHIHAGAVIGNITQALAYKGTESFVKIGDNNIIREYVTINATEGMPTIIGNNNLLMCYSHIAHHCVVKDNVVIANSGTLAGHVTIEDHVVLGGLAAIHQFCKIGQYSIIGGLSKIVMDVIPYVTCDGNPAFIRGLNSIGLKRNGVSSDEISMLKKAYRIIFRSGMKLSDAVKTLEKEFKENEKIDHLIRFINESERGIIRERKNKIS